MPFQIHSAGFPALSAFTLTACGLRSLTRRKNTLVSKDLACTYARHCIPTVSTDTNPGSNVINPCVDATYICLVSGSDSTECTRNWIIILPDQTISKRKSSPLPARGSKPAQFLESLLVKHAVSARFAVITANQPAGSALPMEPIVFMLPEGAMGTSSMYNLARMYQWC